MPTRTARWTAAATLTAAVAAAAPLTTAHAVPALGGCPGGYEVVAVVDLAPLGYRVPGLVDSPLSGVDSFGRPGNGDGLVCAHEIGNRTTTWGGQLYTFLDNSLPV